MLAQEEVLARTEMDMAVRKQRTENTFYREWVSVVGAQLARWIAEETDHFPLAEEMEDFYQAVEVFCVLTGRGEFDLYTGPRPVIERLSHKTQYARGDRTKRYISGAITLFPAQ